MRAAAVPACAAQGVTMNTYSKPTLTKKKPFDVDPKERQLLIRLRQLRNAGKMRAEVELEAEDGPKVREGTG